jgi:hypothetical protein
MCSIEEAWAGQKFDNYPVQSQADLRRKYMSIGDNILGSNNEFSINRKDPTPRVDNYGQNSKMIREQRTPPIARDASNELAVAFSSAPIDNDNYGGINPRPGYMSIYDNAGQGLPMPSQSGGRSNFNDINQAFQVSSAVERFMSAAQNNSNPLLNEDNPEDIRVLAKKFNSTNNNNNNNNYNNNNNNNNNSNSNSNSNNYNNNNNTSNNHVIGNSMDMQVLTQLHTSVNNILARLDRLESELHNGKSRNMYDMVLYILAGMLLAFILYSLLRK